MKVFVSGENNIGSLWKRFATQRFESFSSHYNCFTSSRLAEMLHVSWDFFPRHFVVYPNTPIHINCNDERYHGVFFV
jgi:hypothetical protein